MTPTPRSSKIVAFPESGGSGGKSSFSQVKGSADMRSDLVEEASKVIPEIPVLINLVSTRVKQLNTGRPPLIKADPRMGTSDIALTEIIEGAIGPEEKED